jgi:hypothetical protein
VRAGLPAVANETHRRSQYTVPEAVETARHASCITGLDPSPTAHNPPTHTTKQPHLPQRQQLETEHRGQRAAKTEHEDTHELLANRDGVTAGASPQGPQPAVVYGAEPRTASKTVLQTASRTRRQTASRTVPNTAQPLTSCKHNTTICPATCVLQHPAPAPAEASRTVKYALNPPFEATPTPHDMLPSPMQPSA